MQLVNESENKLHINEISDSLIPSPEGFWVPVLGGDSYQFLPNDETDWFSIEEKSFWYKHRNKCLMEVIKNYPPDGALFEIGAGNGFVSFALQNIGFSVVAIEPDKKSARNAVKRGVKHVISTTLDQGGFKRGTLPSVGIFDVIEHVQDDLLFLNQIRNLMKSHGRLYVAAPAYRWLWSREDEIPGHKRRYTLKQLCNKLLKASFMVEYSTYLFTSLVLPVFLLRALPTFLYLRPPRTHQTSNREHNIENRFVSKVLGCLLDHELNKVKQLKRIHIGTSCLVVAKAL